MLQFNHVSVTHIKSTWLFLATTSSSSTLERIERALSNNSRGRSNLSCLSGIHFLSKSSLLIWSSRLNNVEALCGFPSTVVDMNLLQILTIVNLGVYRVGWFHFLLKYQHFNWIFPYAEIHISTFTKVNDNARVLPHKRIWRLCFLFQ